MMGSKSDAPGTKLKTFPELSLYKLAWNSALMDSHSSSPEMSTQKLASSVENSSNE
jgi:hypothetical protein